MCASAEFPRVSRNFHEERMLEEIQGMKPLAEIETFLKTICSKLEAKRTAQLNRQTRSDLITSLRF